jgi:error-prone DNA polymerase
MEGVSFLEELCWAARLQGADTLALTDTNGLYGAIRFVEVARKAGLRPILGAELRYEQHRVVLLAKTAQGYANLCRLLSARHSEAPFGFVAAVARHRHGLILLSDDTVALTAWKKDSSEDLYVELTPGAMMHEALAFSRRSGLPPVATARVHFVQPREFPVHRLLRAIALNTTLARLPQEACCAAGHWLVPPSSLEKQFPHVPHALTNTRRIAEACRTEWGFKETIFPAFRELPEGEAFALLREKTYAGARWRYGTLAPMVRQRIEHELTVIREKRYAHYFLVVDEIVRQAPRTCGRGSAAASIVSYCLGITHVDPIRHDLFFERFLNPGRHDPPDIDIDFPWDERDRILDFVFARYGAARAAMVANQNTLAFRAAIREVAKVYGMPPDEISRVHRQLERQTVKARSLPSPWPTILTLASRVEGHFRHLGLHCGGVVIVPDEIRRYVPVEVAAKGIPVIQWEKDQCEEAGLVKIDLLGNRSLSVIRDAKELIRRGNTVGCFYVESPATRLLLTKLWTGMPADRRAKADVFDYLVIVSSLIRPAANRFVREFIRRAHGGAYRSLHPVLDAVLAGTHGIMVYQEDVTKVAVELAGFSVEDGDQLRKVLSKKHKQRQLRDYRNQFYQGASVRGVARPVIHAVWEMIMSFTGYSFCKPHSASYAQVSFKSAYLRAHYPAEFMAAVISNQGGFYSTYAYLSEARRMGVTILPPDINASDRAYRGQGRVIRVGLMQIKHLTRSLTDRILAERKAGGLFRSFADFLNRIEPEPTQTQRLIRAGCCDSLAGELTRPALIWRLYAWHGGRNRHSSTAHLGPPQLSAPDSAPSSPPHLSPQSSVLSPSLAPLPIPAEYSESQRVQILREPAGPARD